MTPRWTPRSSGSAGISSGKSRHWAWSGRLQSIQFAAPTRRSYICTCCSAVAEILVAGSAEHVPCPAIDGIGPRVCDRTFQLRPDRRSPPAQRADQAADHRGLLVAASREPGGADADGRARSPSERAIPCARSSSAFPISASFASLRRTTRLAQAAALAPPRNLDGDRQTRIKSQVETRAGTCERGVALWRVLHVQRRRGRGARARASISAASGPSSAWKSCTGPSCRPCLRGSATTSLIALEAITDHRKLGAHARAARLVLRRRPARFGSMPSIACCRRRRRGLTLRETGMAMVIGEAAGSTDRPGPGPARIDGRRLRSLRTGS